MKDTPKTLDEALSRAAALGLDITDPVVRDRIERFYRHFAIGEDFRFDRSVAVWNSVMNSERGGGNLTPSLKSKA